MKNLIKTTITLTFMVVIPLFTVAQDLELLVESSYLRNADNQVLISSEVVDYDEEEPVEGINLSIHLATQEDTVKLASATSNVEGDVAFDPIDYSMLIHDENGYFHFILTSEPTEDFMAYNELYKVRDINLELFLTEEDSVKTMGIKITTWEDGELTGIEDEEIILYAQRLFSKLKIGETWTDAEGEDSDEFPTDLPGGPAGEVTIIAALEDHGDFGTVFVEDIINWGIPLAVEDSANERELFSADAPVWMIVTFWVLMTGVWVHYFWMIFKLRSISKNRSEENTEILFSN